MKVLCPAAICTLVLPCIDVILQKGSAYQNMGRVFLVSEFYISTKKEPLVNVVKKQNNYICKCYILFV